MHAVRLGGCWQLAAGGAMAWPVSNTNGQPCMALLAVVLASSAMVHGSARDTLRVVATGVYKPCYMVATGTSATERLLDCS